MKKIVLAVFLLGLVVPAVAQHNSGTISANSQCVSVNVNRSTSSTVYIDVAGTFSITLQPQVLTAGGTARNTQVTPTSSSTAQATITAAGGFWSVAAGVDFYQVCSTAYVSGSATVSLTVTNGVAFNLNGGGGGGGTVTAVTGTSPIVSSGGTTPAISYSGCLSDTVTAAAFGCPVTITTVSPAIPLTLNGASLMTGTLLSTPTAPSSGTALQYPDSTANAWCSESSAGLVYCPTQYNISTGTYTFNANASLTSAGALTVASCTGCGSGTTPLNNVVSPTGAIATIADGNNPLTISSAQTTNNQSAVSFTEASAATGGSGNNELAVTTAANSASTDLSVTQGAISTVFPTAAVNISQGSNTGTTAVPALNISSTWNNASLAGSGIKLSVTNSASTAASTLLLLDGGTGGATQEFAVTAGGLVQATSNIETASGNYYGTAASTAVTIASGTGTTSSNGAAPAMIAQGEDNSSTGAAVVGGTGILRGGLASAASPNAAALMGPAEVAGGALKGSAIANVGDVLCSTTTAETVTDCPTGATNIVGIATSTSNPVTFVSDGQVPVKTDNATTAGDILCAPSVTVGLAHDNGTTSCGPGVTTIGTVQANSGTNAVTIPSGTSTTTATPASTLPLAQLHIASTPATVPINDVVSATGAITALANGNNPLTINCALTSGTTCLTTGETTAATTAGAVEHQITTLTTTTAIPLQITQGAAGPAAANAPAVLNVSAAAAGGAASASINGLTGAPITLLTGAGSAGGATTGNGGTGGAFTVTLGAGGAHGGTTTNTGGVGGAFALTPGAGTQGAATGAGGAAGTYTVSGAAGGAGGSTSGTGGAGSDFLVTTGTGGAATSGSTTGRGGNAVFTLGSAGGTGTAGTPGQFEVVGGTVAAANTTPFFNQTGTWNTTGVVDAGIFENITNTASGSGSKLMDLQASSTSQLAVASQAANSFALGPNLVLGGTAPEITLGGTTPYLALSGLAQANKNTCDFALTAQSSNSATSLCSTVITLPASAQKWHFLCQGVWEVSASTTPTLTMGITFSQAPSATGLIAGTISTSNGSYTTSPTAASGSVVSLSTGNNNIVSAATITPAATYFPFQMNGWFTGSATSGTFSPTMTVGTSGSTWAAAGECIVF